MKFIHFNCLKNWLESWWETKTTEYSYSYYWWELQCELCKTTFPDKISYKSKELKILDYKVPEDQPYIIIETYSKLCNNSWIMHVVNFTTSKEVKLGWGHESNIRVTDISVSWVHATIEVHQGKFFLRDENSKFGTLIGLDRPRLLV